MTIETFSKSSSVFKGATATYLSDPLGILIFDNAGAD